MEQALRRWDADKIGIPDYALESSGKCRVHVWTSLSLGGMVLNGLGAVSYEIQRLSI